LAAAVAVTIAVRAGTGGLLPLPFRTRGRLL
jgi:hypothetical protein